MLADFRIFLRHVMSVGYLVRHISLAMLAVLGLLALALSVTEGLSLGDAVYLTATTGLAITYGDIVPKTVIGRILCIAVGLVGVTFVGITVAVANNAVIRLIAEKAAGSSEGGSDVRPPSG